MSDAKHFEMVLASLKLQERLRAVGYRKGDGVSHAGISLVKRAAQRHGIPDWPHTRTVADYNALQIAVEAELKMEGKV